MTSNVIEVHGSREEAYSWRPSAKIILDSISPEGHRLTTFQVELHRYVLAEFNTHRLFSRNSASSRAIPYSKMRAKAVESPALPLSWPAEQSGMQGGEELDTARQDFARRKWLHARDQAVKAADELHMAGLHKSVINRLLEPFLSHVIIVSATDYSGFFEQRCSSLAQPEIRVAAEAMKEAYDASTPLEVPFGLWHMPYISDDDWEDALEQNIVTHQRIDLFKKISAARCARVSYLTHDGKRDWDKDLDLHKRLVTARPGHWSPLEHVATPGVPLTGPIRGNFKGWSQLRHKVEYR